MMRDIRRRLTVVDPNIVELTDVIMQSIMNVVLCCHETNLILV